MALSLVNVNYRDCQSEQIQKASDIGMNAVIITVRWDVIYQLSGHVPVIPSIGFLGDFYFKK